MSRRSDPKLRHHASSTTYHTTNTAKRSENEGEVDKQCRFGCWVSDGMLVSAAAARGSVISPANTAVAPLLAMVAASTAAASHDLLLTKHSPIVRHAPGGDVRADRTGLNRVRSCAAVARVWRTGRSGMCCNRWNYERQNGTAPLGRRLVRWYYAKRRGSPTTLSRIGMTLEGRYAPHVGRVLEAHLRCLWTRAVHAIVQLALTNVGQLHLAERFRTSYCCAAPIGGVERSISHGHRDRQ
jgi:hypothetical protein